MLISCTARTCALSAPGAAPSAPIPRCKAGIAAVFLATGEVEKALALLSSTNSFAAAAKHAARISSVGDDEIVAVILAALEESDQIKS